MKHFKKILLPLLLWLCLPYALAAQPVVKDIVVSAQHSFTDNLSLNPDSRDLDVMVKVVFNENDNTLTVSLISYRNLFVFRDDARYNQVVKGNKIKVENLPYVAETAPLTQYRLTGDLRKMLPKDKKEFVFNSWCQVDGMQVQQTPYKMVNDFIEQTFDIKPNRNNVTFTLRDILVMDKTSKPDAKKTVYDFVFWRDLNTRYAVTLQRDPCIVQAAALESAKAAAAGVKQSLDSLRSNYKTLSVTTQSQLDNFKKIKETLVNQFQPHDTVNPCEQINEVWRDYNAVVDTIAAFNVKLETPEQHLKAQGDASVANKAVDTQTLYSSARTLDRLTNDWILSNDYNERKEIVKSGNEIIINIEKMITSSAINTPEQHQAVNIFRKAAQYHKSVTNKRN